MEDLIKCYCGHTTTCDCIPEQKKSYSDEEVITFLLNCRSENPIDVEEWFEQFKK